MTNQVAAAPNPRARMPIKSRRWRFTVLAVAALAAGGCGNDSDGEGARTETLDSARTSQTPAASDVGLPYHGLCAALEAARKGDLTSARQAFDHGPLHELAEEAIAIDRSVAARLLEAKEAVESALAEDGAPVTEVAEKLQTLVDATSAALTTTGSPKNEICTQETP